ncbi:hypothetical protein [Halomonas alkalisoli]
MTCASCVGRVEKAIHENSTRRHAHARAQHR